MRKTAEKINAMCGVGAYSGFGLLFIGIVFGAVGSAGDLGESKDLRQTVENVAIGFEAHAVVEGNNVLDNPVSSFPTSGLSILDSDITVKVIGDMRDGYCIIGTDASIAQEKSKTIQYSSRDSTSNQLGIDTCDIDITNASTIVEGLPEEEGMNWVDWTAALATGGGVLALSSSIGGYANASREEKYEKRLPRPLISSSEPPKKSNETEISVKESDELDNLMDKVANIKTEWASYEWDLMKLLDYPSVTNMSVHSTAEFHKALKHVNHLATLHTAKSGVTTSDFRQAVLDLEHKFDVMINEAKRTKWNGYSKREQNSLRTAQNLLSIAINSASSMNERQIAYKRLIKEVEGILVFPEKAVLELEAKVSPAITVADLLGGKQEDAVPSFAKH